MKRYVLRVNHETTTRDLVAQSLACGAYHQRVVESRKVYRRHAKHRNEWGF